MRKKISTAKVSEIFNVGSVPWQLQTIVLTIAAIWTFTQIQISPDHGDVLFMNIHTLPWVLATIVVAASLKSVLPAVISLNVATAALFTWAFGGPDLAEFVRPVALIAGGVSLGSALIFLMVRQLKQS